MKSKLNEFALLMDQSLENLLGSDGEVKYSEHYNAMKYSLLSGGKRLRPFILGLFYHAAGKMDNNYLNFAAALEMIHTYSLIHDDLPSMDDDDFRRGRPSCHKAFGEANALLAGDGLLTKAFEVAAKTDGVASNLIVDSIKELAFFAGADGMIGGQVIDLAIEKEQAPLDTILEMYKKKTGALLVAAARIGTILAGGNDTLKKAAENYAYNLGIAFQIQDDILDVVGDAQLLGKPVGSDDKNQKSTYISIKGIDVAKQDVLIYTDQAKAALSPFGESACDLIDLADYLIDRKY